MGIDHSRFWYGLRYRLDVGTSDDGEVDPDWDMPFVNAMDEPIDAPAPTPSHDDWEDDCDEDWDDWYPPDPRVVAARSVGLDASWGGGRRSNGEYFLLIGTELGRLGWPGDYHVWLSDDAYDEICRRTRTLLVRGGFEGTPALHLQYDPYR